GQRVRIPPEAGTPAGDLRSGRGRGNPPSSGLRPSSPPGEKGETRAQRWSGRGPLGATPEPQMTHGRRGDPISPSSGPPGHLPPAGGKGWEPRAGQGALAPPSDAARRSPGPASAPR